MQSAPATNNINNINNYGYQIQTVAPPQLQQYRPQPMGAPRQMVDLHDFSIDINYDQQLPESKGNNNIWK